ncbi:MAG: hypothetical protein RR235_09830 [Oscillospiraceae bacterium]
MLNEKTVTLKMKRIDLCDLMIAVHAVSNSSDAKKWNELSELLERQLKEFDAKHIEG